MPGPAPSDPLDPDGSTPSGSEDYAGDGERSTSPINLGKKPLREVLRNGVMGVGELAHDRLATTVVEQDEGLWLIDEPEAAKIADPLANIAGRYAGGQVVDSTVADLISAGVAFAAYVGANLIKRFKIRRAYKRAGYQMTPDEGQEQ